MLPQKIDGFWRVVNMKGEIISSIIFDSWDDAAAYCDKFDDLKGQI